MKFGNVLRTTSGQRSRTSSDKLSRTSCSRRSAVLATGLVASFALSAWSIEHDPVLDTTPGDELRASREARGISEFGFASSSADQGTPDGDDSAQVTLPKRTITMAFAGDMMFEQHLLPLA